MKLINIKCKFIYFFDFQSSFNMLHSRAWDAIRYAISPSTRTISLNTKLFFHLPHSRIYYYKNNALSHTYKLQFIIASRNFVSLWSHHRQMEMKCTESDKRAMKIKRIIKAHSWGCVRILSFREDFNNNEISMKSGTFEWHFIKWKIAISLKDTHTHTHILLSECEELIVVALIITTLIIF